MMQLLVLLGTPGHMRLAWFDGIRETAVALPDADARWVAGSPSQGLVATVGPAGRIYLSGPLVAGRPVAWHDLPVDAAGRQWLDQPLADAVPDPVSDAIAVVAADPASGFAGGHLVILDRSGRRGRAVAMAGRWDGRAPAWLDGGRIAISTRDTSDAVGLTIVDPATGLTLHRGTAIAACAASGDRRTIAWQDRDTRQFVVETVAGFGAREAQETLALDPVGRLAAQLLLDTTGRRMTVAWLDDAGDTTAYSIYELGAGGWAIVRAGALPPGTSRAVLVSLGP
jgi:hypothetical protein